MRSLTGSSIPNIDTSDLANYPRGRFKNDSTPTAADGTELSERTLGDLYQAAIELLRRAGITPSETAEKKGESDIADAVEMLGLRPVAIIRAGYDQNLSSIALLGGRFATGWSATFSENAIYGTTSIDMNLKIKEDGVDSISNLFVSISFAKSTMPYGAVTAHHGNNGAAPSLDGIYFNNNLSANILFADSTQTDATLLRKSCQFIINVYKAD